MSTSGYVLCFKWSNYWHTFRIHSKFYWGNSMSAKTWTSSLSKVWLELIPLIERLTLVDVTLFVPWILLCSSVCWVFSSKTIPSAEAIFVNIIDTTLPLSRKDSGSVVFTGLPSLESVTGSIWRIEGPSADPAVLQCVEFAYWLDSSCKCLWWRLLPLLQLCIEGPCFEECPNFRQLKQALSW